MIAMPMIHQGFVEWLRPPEKPLLEHSGLHLWRVDLELLGQTDEFGQILSHDEKARYLRLLLPKKKESLIAGRAALRLIMAKYLNLLPKAIRFRYSKMGKPYLVNPGRALDIRFNLSHSGRWMVLGVCEHADLGVDIEEVRPIQKAWALEKLFTSDERENLAGLPEIEKDAAFIAAWTEKEAAAKASGAGLSGNPANKDNRINANTLSRTDPYWFIHFEPAPGYLGCAALRSTEKPCVNFYEFSLGN